MAFRGPLSPHQAPGRGAATARDPSQATPPSMVFFAARGPRASTIRPHHACTGPNSHHEDGWKKLRNPTVSRYTHGHALFSRAPACRGVARGRRMNFFDDLRAAATDLHKNGLNLDHLREEIGTDARAPLPPPPPRRGARVAADEPPAAPATTGSAAKQRALDERPLRVGPADEQPPPAARAAAPMAAAPVAAAPAAAAPAAAAPAAAALTPAKKAAPGDVVAPTSKTVAPQFFETVSGGLSAIGGLGGKLAESAREARERMDEHVEALKAAAGREVEGERVQKRALEADLKAARAAAAKWEAEAGAKAAEATQLEADVVASRRLEAGSAAELEASKRSSQQNARLVDQMRMERDAVAQELEAVALREVDALQAEVAGLRRHKARADKCEAALESLRASQRENDAESKQQAQSHDEARRAKITLDAARLSAAAAARASRAAVDVAEARADAADRGRADLERRASDAEAAAANLKRRLEAAAAELKDVQSAHVADSRRSRDADELRSLLRAAVEDAAAAKKRTAALEASSAALEAKTKKDLEYSAGELAAAREAARLARAALVGGGAPAAPGTDSPRRAASDNADADGSIAYLRTILRTVLPSRAVADAATRNRLHSVLRSLLSLPHDTVVDNIDALALSGTGGDFALALLAAADHHSRNIVSAREAQDAAQATALRISLLGDLDDSRQALATATARSAALDDALRDARAAAKAQAAGLGAQCAAAADRCAALEALAAAAAEAAAQARDSHAAAAKEETRRSAAGLDASQLEYLRTTLTCFLQATPVMKRQLGPVLVRVLKLKESDDQAKALLELF
ncbi:hypothetical protein M885DRAFT_531315 [Pelagophyceae sp. CCMP2097]|nr:hypothetical protein M885DRAFT_531315 [Pelagophyceae sp. CCMP2097]